MFMFPTAVFLNSLLLHPQGFTRFLSCNVCRDDVDTNSKIWFHTWLFLESRLTFQVNWYCLQTMILSCHWQSFLFSFPVNCHKTWIIQWEGWKTCLQRPGRTNNCYQCCRSLYYWTLHYYSIHRQKLWTEAKDVRTMKWRESRKPALKILTTEQVLEDLHFICFFRHFFYEPIWLISCCKTFKWCWLTSCCVRCCPWIW